ncbi:MAG: ferrous iron transport protein A [Chitinophagales bacterium]|nr:ferrous iron transport protein A [Chitinophagales bacterium]
MIAQAGTTKLLTDISIGQEEIVARFTNDLIGGKLMAMGLLPGTKVRVIRKAPFGGSWYIKAGNFYLALRKGEAASIVLK